MYQYNQHSHILQDLLESSIAASIEAHKLLGKGDEKGADKLAVEAMRRYLNYSNIDGTIVIGEGERDEAPMLYIGEQVGAKISPKIAPKIEIAVDPLEGTTILAHGGAGSLSVIAASLGGGMLHAPDIYMEKIAIGFNFAEQIIDLDLSPAENLASVAKAKGKAVEDMLVIILNRPRHEEMIAKIREAKARVKLISDGDISAIIQTSDIGYADMYIGIGGAPEGVLAASALQTLGGQICARLIVRNEAETIRANNLGITDFSKKYYLNDLAPKDSLFVATGVTDGELLKGVSYVEGKVHVNSLVINGHKKSVDFIQSTRMLE
ncbi:MAG: class II fructose-bisphosphatase [Alphaproteobacteria bacterium]|nr:class II fructose-bisphosphatase [Alphaproteobacteria bacterium]